MVLRGWPSSCTRTRGRPACRGCMWSVSGHRYLWKGLREQKGAGDLCLECGAGSGVLAPAEEPAPHSGFVPPGALRHHLLPAWPTRQFPSCCRRTFLSSGSCRSRRKRRPLRPVSLPLGALGLLGNTLQPDGGQAAGECQGSPGPPFLSRFSGGQGGCGQRWARVLTTGCQRPVAGRDLPSVEPAG